eukprot:g4852.t1
MAPKKIIEKERQRRQDVLDLLDACKTGDIANVRRLLAYSVDCSTRVPVPLPSDPPPQRASNTLDPNQQTCPDSPTSRNEWLPLNGNVNDGPSQGWSCLHAACGPGRGSRCSIIALLLNAGARVNLRSSLPSGNTPLHVACANGRQPEAELLLLHGADIEMRDLEGRTPLDLARQLGFHELTAGIIEIIAQRQQDSVDIRPGSVQFAERQLQPNNHPVQVRSLGLQFLQSLISTTTEDVSGSIEDKELETTSLTTNEGSLLQPLRVATEMLDQLDVLEVFDEWAPPRRPLDEEILLLQKMTFASYQDKQVGKGSSKAKSKNVLHSPGQAIVEGGFWKSVCRPQGVCFWGVAFTEPSVLSSVSLAWHGKWLPRHIIIEVALLSKNAKQNNNTSNFGSKIKEVSKTVGICDGEVDTTIKDRNNSTLVPSVLEVAEQLQWTPIRCISAQELKKAATNTKENSRNEIRTFSLKMPSEETSSLMRGNAKATHVRLIFSGYAPGNNDGIYSLRHISFRRRISTSFNDENSGLQKREMKLVELDNDDSEDDDDIDMGDETISGAFELIDNLSNSKRIMSEQGDASRTLQSLRRWVAAACQHDNAEIQSVALKCLSKLVLASGSLVTGLRLLLALVQASEKNNCEKESKTFDFEPFVEELETHAERQLLDLRDHEETQRKKGATILASGCIADAAFDSTSLSHPGLILSDSGMSVRCTTGSYCSVLLNVGFSSGKASWQMRLTEDTTSQCTCFGAATKPVTNHGYERSPDLWMYRAYNGQLYCRGVAHGKKCRRIYKDDVIRIALDMDIGTMQYWINGEDQGIAFTNMNEFGEVFPAVCFYGSSRSVRLIKVEGTGTATPIHLCNMEPSVVAVANGTELGRCGLMGHNFGAPLAFTDLIAPREPGDDESEERTLALAQLLAHVSERGTELNRQPVRLSGNENDDNNTENITEESGTNTTVVSESSSLDVQRPMPQSFASVSLGDSPLAQGNIVETRHNSSPFQPQHLSIRAISPMLLADPVSSAESPLMSRSMVGLRRGVEEEEVEGDDARFLSYSAALPDTVSSSARGVAVYAHSPFQSQTWPSPDVPQHPTVTSPASSVQNIQPAKTSWVARVCVKGKSCDRALSMLPPKGGVACVCYRLDRRFEEFRSSFALDDSAYKLINKFARVEENTPSISFPVVSFEVWGDGFLLWDSSSIEDRGDFFAAANVSETERNSNKGKKAICTGDMQVSVVGVRDLALVVRCASSNEAAFAVWVSPFIVPESMSSIWYRRTFAAVPMHLNFEADKILPKTIMSENDTTDENENEKVDVGCRKTIDVQSSPLFIAKVILQRLASMACMCLREMRDDLPPRGGSQFPPGSQSSSLIPNENSDLDLNEEGGAVIAGDVVEGRLHQESRELFKNAASRRNSSKQFVSCFASSMPVGLGISGGVRRSGSMRNITSVVAAAAAASEAVAHIEKKGDIDSEAAKVARKNAAARLEAVSIAQARALAQAKTGLEAPFVVEVSALSFGLQTKLLNILLPSASKGIEPQNQMVLSLLEITKANLRRLTVSGIDPAEAGVDVTSDDIDRFHRSEAISTKMFLNSQKEKIAFLKKMDKLDNEKIETNLVKTNEIDAINKCDSSGYKEGPGGVEPLGSPLLKRRRGEPKVLVIGVESEAQVRAQAEANAAVVAASLAPRPKNMDILDHSIEKRCKDVAGKEEDDKEKRIEEEAGEEEKLLLQNPIDLEKGEDDHVSINSGNREPIGESSNTKRLNELRQILENMLVLDTEENSVKREKTQKRLLRLAATETLRTGAALFYSPEQRLQSTLHHGAKCGVIEVQLRWPSERALGPDNRFERLLLLLQLMCRRKRWRQAFCGEWIRLAYVVIEVPESTDVLRFLACELSKCFQRAHFRSWRFPSGLPAFPILCEKFVDWDRGKRLVHTPGLGYVRLYARSEGETPLFERVCSTIRNFAPWPVEEADDTQTNVFMNALGVQDLK